SALGPINGGPAADGDKEGADNTTAYVSGGAILSPMFRVDGFARYDDSHGEGDGQDFNFGANQGLWYDDASEFDAETYNIAGAGTLTLLDGKWVTVFSANYTHTESFFDDNLGTAFSTFASDGERKKYAVQSSYTFGPDDFVSTVTGFGEIKDENSSNNG